MYIFRDWLWSIKAPLSAAMLINTFCDISHTVLYSLLMWAGISSMLCTEPP